MKSCLSLLIAFTAISFSSHAETNCKVALLNRIKGGNYPETSQNLKNAVGAELVKTNKNNNMFIVESAFIAGRTGSDYLFLMNNYSGGIKIIVKDIVLNKLVYTNTYENSSFTSLNETIKTIADDFKTDALPAMDICQ